ncbi:BBE domain-containing protein [Clostridium botulinum]|nr:BBE domain-containing protein [Clostridium botulinum]MCS4482992.1 BBE domain-containing protein [Clostridium botulinum]
MNGTYVNWPDIFIKNWPCAYYGTNYHELMQIKSKYDSENIFHFEQSIRPAKKEIIDNTHNKIGLVDNVEKFALIGEEIYPTFNDQSLTLYSGFYQPCFASTNKKPTTDLWWVFHVCKEV